jgi:hypothetical protein
MYPMELTVRELAKVLTDKEWLALKRDLATFEIKREVIEKIKKEQTQQEVIAWMEVCFIHGNKDSFWASDFESIFSDTDEALMFLSGMVDENLLIRMSDGLFTWC